MAQNFVDFQDRPGAEPQAPDDRRRHARAPINLKARFLTEPGDEFPCLVSNISAGGALLRAKNPPPAGQKIVLYIDDVGRFEGRVVRSGKHSFAVDYRGRRAKSKRTADALIAAMNAPRRASDRRSAPRVKTDSEATVRLANGETISCSIRDISLTGASIDISPQPPLGAELQLGRMIARVVRRHETGVGLVFTGSSEHMEDVIEKSTAPAQSAAVETGPPVARRFGRKEHSA